MKFFLTKENGSYNFHINLNKLKKPKTLLKKKIYKNNYNTEVSYELLLKNDKK